MIQELVNRIQALKKRVARLEDIIPESIEPPDEGGVVIVKITGVHSDSPGDDDTPHVFQGDVYGNGTRNSPTETDVTIFLMGIPYDEDTDYRNNPVLAARIPQKWTGASNTHTEEVYEAEWLPKIGCNS